MENKIVVGLISASVAIIMIALVLSPIIADAVNDQYEYFNNSTGQYSSIVGSERLVLDLTYNGYDPVYTVNGEPVTLLTDSNDVIIATNCLMFKVVNLRTNTGINNIVCAYDSENGSVKWDNVTSFNAVIENNTISVTYTTADGSTKELTLSYDWGFYTTASGDYRAMWVPFTAFFNDVSQVYGAYWVNTTNKFFSYVGENVFYDGSNTQMTYTATKVNNATNVWTLSQTPNSSTITFDVDNNGEPYTVSPYLAIVPATIVGDKSNHSDAISAMLSAIIPLIIIAVALTSVFLIRRY